MIARGFSLALWGQRTCSMSMWLSTSYPS